MRVFGSAAAALLVLLALYVGSYYASVERSFHYVVGNDGTLFRSADYRFGGRTAESVYTPWHTVDRKLRGGYWTESIFVDGEDLPIHFVTRPLKKPAVTTVE